MGRKPAPEVLDHLHMKLVEIAQRCNETGSSDYSVEDVQRIQNQLNRVDDEYQEIVRLQKGEVSEDPYELPGEAQVASELSVLHNATASMLQNIE